MKTIDFYLHKIIRYLTPAISFLPLVVMSNFYFPYITPRNFVFRIIVSILLALYLFLFFRNRRKYKPVLSSFFIAYLALGLIMTLSSIFGGDFLYSFWSDYERMEGLLGYYYLVAYFIVIIGVYYRKKAWHQLLYVSTFASFIIAFIAFSQILKIQLLVAATAGDRVTATMGNPTYLAAYAMFNLFFALYLFFKDRRAKLKFELIGFYVLDALVIYFEIKARQNGHAGGTLSVIFQHWYLLMVFLVPQILLHLNCYLPVIKKSVIKYSRLMYYVLIIFLNFLALFHTQTRGALLGLFLGIIVGAMFMVFAGRVSKKIKLTAVALIVIVVVFIGTAFVFKNSDFVKNNKAFRRLSDISLSDTTAQTRLLTWQLSLKGWQEKPILGWGEEQFSVVFNKYFPIAIFKRASSTVWFDRPHNIFIQYLVNGGALGFIAYVSIYVLVLIGLFKHYRRSKDALSVSIFSAALIGYGVQNFFVFDSINTSILFILYLAVVTCVTSRRPKIESVTVAAPTPRANVAAYLALLAVLIIGYSLNVPQLMTNKKFVENYAKLKSSSVYNEQAQQNFIDIINKHYFGKFEARQVYSDYAVSVAQNKNMDKSDRTKIVNLAEQEILKTIAEQPSNVRNYAFLINLYLAAAENLDKSYADKNIALIEKAIPLSPTRTPLYYSLGRAYMIRGESDKAIQQFEKAREISPDVFESYVNVMVAYLTVKDFDKAKTIVEETKQRMAFRLNDGKALREDYYGRLAEVYYFFRLPKEALTTLEEALNIYPEGTDLLAQLIVYNVQGGDKDKANFYIDKLEKLDPAMAAEARQMVSQTSQDPASKK